MIGIIIQLAISWIIIWVFEKKHLTVLGFRPSTQRIKDFIVFLIITAGFCSLGFLMKQYFGKQVWILNPAVSFSLLLKGIWWNISSVIFEELIFRGVLLYIMIKKLGTGAAIIISSIAFGIYHWFSFGVIGNIPQMAIAFVTTACMGLVLAYGYAKTFSLYIPVAIHLGWNITQIFIFSQGPIGKGIFIPVFGRQFRTDSYFIFFLVTFLPMILALVINYSLIKKHQQATAK